MGNGASENGSDPLLQNVIGHCFMMKDTLSLSHGTLDAMCKIAAETAGESLKCVSGMYQSIFQHNPSPFSALRIEEVHCESARSVDAGQGRTPALIFHKHLPLIRLVGLASIYGDPSYQPM
jgi:hypothetical protein